MRILPLTLGDHAHGPFLNAKVEASKGNKNVSVSFWLSPLFLLIHQISASAVHLFPGPSTHHLSFLQISCASVCLSCCNNCNSNHSQPLKWASCVHREELSRMQCQLPTPRESTVSLPCFKESCSSVVTFESFHYLSARISGAHSGLLTCPCLTALLTFAACIQLTKWWQRCV